tara:strand:- start:62 stop:787 length:726 start_codon:yes stop_codon:yes gene_type:complete
MSDRVVLILQARMGSERLPGKSMMDLCGQPLIYRIIERVKRCNMLDDIVLAIPDNPENEVLKKVADLASVNVYEGSENNVLNRYYEAAKKFNADIVCRIPADNATPEPSEIDKIIKHHLKLKHPGFSSNLAQIFNSGYPDGIGCEVFSFSLLEEVENRENDQKKREHVHLNFFDYDSQKPVDQSWCPVSTINCPEDFKRPELVLDVNTEEQYKFIKSLYEDLYPTNPEFDIIDIIEWLDKK